MQRFFSSLFAMDQFTHSFDNLTLAVQCEHCSLNDQWVSHGYVWKKSGEKQLNEAFPFNTAPNYLLRGRDSIYGDRFRNRIKSLGIEEVITAPRSPWQNPYVERIIGSIRRVCLSHLIMLNERHLLRQLKS